MSRSVRDIFGVACPGCGSDGELMVVVTVWAALSTDGTEPEGDHEWNEDSAMSCRACGHGGKVAAFRCEEREGEGRP